MPNLSVIITFYDETAFIDMAIASVLSQSIDDLELIVVNDNPEKFGPPFFDSLRLRDQISVIHHPENRGLSAARNTGIAASSAPLISFLDGDDYFITGGLVRQLAFAVETGADVTHAACYINQPGTPNLELLRRDGLLFSNPFIGAGLLHFEKAQFFTSSWASLYRRDFLDMFDLRFDVDQPKFEDRLFVLQTVTAARRIATLGEPVRVWRQRAGSISVTPPDSYIHGLQIQLVEKCLYHMRREVTKGRLPLRFEKRELFNTVGRLIWDMDIIEPIANGKDPVYKSFGERIIKLLGNDRFGHAIFDDPILTQLSRVGMHTRKGFVSRSVFFDIHKALRHGDFVGVQAILKDARKLGAPKPAKLPSPIEADVIVHFGMHKTGSTFIQHHLDFYRDILLKFGVFVPGKKFQGTSENPIREGAFPGHSRLITGLRQASQKSNIWNDLRREAEDSGAQTVLISCENMLFPLNQDREKMVSQLMDHLGMFRSMRAVAFVRRPDSYVEALYREIVSNGRRMGSRSIQEFMVDHAKTLTDLPTLFRSIEARSGEAVTFLDFDASVKAGSIWQSFCKACDFQSDLPVLKAPTYPSPDRNSTEAARIVNMLVSDQVQRQRMLRDLFAAVHTSTDKLSLLSPQERRSLIDMFEVSSTHFASTRGYDVSPEKMRSSLPKKWKPMNGLDSATVVALLQSRQRSEVAPENPTKPPPKSDSKPKLMKHNTSTESIDIQPSLLTLRIRPRPWVMIVLKWLKIQ